jgi:hypothetical protein
MAVTPLCISLTEWKDYILQNLGTEMRNNRQSNCFCILYYSMQHVSAYQANTTKKKLLYEPHTPFHISNVYCWRPNFTFIIKA